MKIARARQNRSLGLLIRTSDVHFIFDLCSSSKLHAPLYELCLMVRFFYVPLFAFVPNGQTAMTLHTVVPESKSIPAPEISLSRSIAWAIAAALFCSGGLNGIVKGLWKDGG
jgi:hypothetical protein